MTNAYAIAGPNLVDQGYSAIPIMPGTKRPGTRAQGRWHGDLDWTRFCERLPTDIETEAWSKWPDGGVCVALGKASGGLVAVDVDCDRPEVIEAIRGALPEESPVQKMGRKGFTAFYRARPVVLSSAFNINGDRALDLLAHGKQTILPPTIHPDSQKPYVWLTEATLETLTVDRLPMLPDDVAARLGAALRPFGYYAPVERPAASEGGGLWREINDVALTRFGDWLPGLGMDAKRQHNGTWRGRAIWKGAENLNVGFSPTGIKDWGEDRGMTALDVVMAAHGVDFPTAEKWLREKLGFKEPEPVRFIFRKREPDIEPDSPAVEIPINAPLPALNPFDHAVAGGLLQQTAEWIMESSFVPSKELSLLAALGVMTAFMGRRYVGPSGLAPNLYLVGLASTGSGKDAPLKAVKSLFIRAGGMEHMLGAGDLASDAVIEKLIRARPACISAMDEIGAWLQESSGRNAGQYAKNRRKTLLELYASSSVGGIYLGKDRAGAETLSSSEPVFSPCFSLLGMSTPELFFKGLTEENTVDGFLNRLTVVHIPPCNVVNFKLPTQADIPGALKDAFEDAFNAWPAQDPIQRINYRNAKAPPYLHVVPYADEAAESRWLAIWRWQEETINDATNTAGIVKRCAEQTLKLAMIRAVSRDFSAPAVTLEDVDFGYAIVEASINMMSEGLKNYLSGSEFEDNCKTLLRAVEGVKDGLTDTQLSKRHGVSKIEPRKLRDAKAWLTETGRWEAKKGNRGVRYVALGSREAVED